jgi:hypothetical protein
VWRGAVSGQHADTSDATLGAMQDSLTDDESESVQRLLGREGDQYEAKIFDRLDAVNQKWNGRAAAARLISMAIMQMRPRDLRSGVPIDLDELRLSLDDRDLSDLFHLIEGCPDVIAGTVLLLDGDASDLAAASKEVLASHAIDAEAAEALRRGDFEDFTDQRFHLLADLVQSFLEEKTGLHQTDRPEVSAIVRKVKALGAAE